MPVLFQQKEILNRNEKRYNIMQFQTHAVSIFSNTTVTIVSDHISSHKDFDFFVFFFFWEVTISSSSESPIPTNFFWLLVYLMELIQTALPISDKATYVMLTSWRFLKFIEEGHIHHMFAHFDRVLKHESENLYPNENHI